MRGCAITLTLLAHINAAFVQPITWVSAVYAQAEFWGGVYLFFVISGYVVTRGFWDECADRTRPISDVMRVFYSRRFFRIVLPAWFWIGCTLLCAGVLNIEGVLGNFRQNSIQALAAATSTYNLVFPLWSYAFGIYWSLTLEEQFYLCFPMLARVDWRTRALILISPIVVAAFFRRPAGVFLTFIPLDALCWGVLLGLAERAGLLARWEPRFLWHPPAALMSLTASMLALVLIPSWLKALAPATSLMVLVCVWLVFCASFDKGYARPIKAEWLRLIGTVSFSLYLCHCLAFLLARGVGLFVQNHWGGSPGLLSIGSVALGLLLTFVFTILSYRLIEEPARRRSRRARFGNADSWFDPAMTNQ